MVFIRSASLNFRGPAPLVIQEGPSGEYHEKQTDGAENSEKYNVHLGAERGQHLSTERHAHQATEEGLVKNRRMNRHEDRKNLRNAQGNVAGAQIPPKLFVITLPLQRERVSAYILAMVVGNSLSNQHRYHHEDRTIDKAPERRENIKLPDHATHVEEQSKHDNN